MENIRVLGEAERASLERFLKANPAGMALRGYLAKDGTTPKYGVYAGVLEGDEVVSVAAFLGTTIHLLAPQKLEQLMAVLGKSRRTEVHQINGPSLQVSRLRAWLDATDARTLMHSKDELFVLRLQDLRVPPGVGQPSLRCRLAGAEDLPLQGAWRHDFWVENLGAPPGPRLLENCTKLAELEIAEKTLYVLEEGGRPVCTLAFGPALPDAVQVVNVFTPPAERGHGYARTLTALALLQSRAQGVELGILYTGLENTAAQRTYRALGFQVVGEVTMLVFAEPRQAVPGG